LNNIYDTPNANLSDLDASTVDKKLYKISGIGLAAFFGTIFASGILMAINYQRLGYQAAAKKTLVWSGIATLVLFGIIFLIPEDTKIPNSAFTIPQIIAMVQLAKRYQQDKLEAHVASGGLLASNWKAFGISLLVLIPLFLLIFTVAFFVA